MFHSYRREVEFAIETVQRATRLGLNIQRQTGGDELQKEDRTPATVADFAIQAFVAARLGEVFPDSRLVAEEDSRMLRRPDHSHILEQVTQFVARELPAATPEAVCAWIDLGAAQPEGKFWVLDPVDGTAGFLRGDQWVVALALIDAGQVVMGALGCPRLSVSMAPGEASEASLAVAVLGEGAEVASLDGSTFSPLSVSSTEDPSQARLLQSVEPGHTDMEKMAELRRTLGVNTSPVKMDSQAKYALLAAGRGDLLFRIPPPDRPGYREKIWDQAAGCILVEEAGGRVTDLRGKPLDFTAGRELERNRGVLVSNGRLHELALRAVEATHADRPPAGK